MLLEVYNCVQFCRGVSAWCVSTMLQCICVEFAVICCCVTVLFKYGSSYGLVCCEYGFLMIPHFVEVRTLIMLIVLCALFAAKSMCLL